LSIDKKEKDFIWAINYSMSITKSFKTKKSKYSRHLVLNQYAYCYYCC